MNAPASLPTRPDCFYFGPPERSLFGWLHRPAAGAPMRVEGMVVCNPFGSEQLSAHRSLRHFAETAAAAGVPALRFDYDGTGDSAGSDRDPGRWAAWLKSVHDAADELRRRTGVLRVHLLGLRLGATLAALAAAEREDVASLIAIVPVVSGRQWLHELEALQASIWIGEPPPGTKVEADLHESAGFVITPETRASMAAIDLLALEKRPAPSVLLVNRSDLAPNDRLAHHLTALSADVDQVGLSGYTEMMLDAHETILPSAMIDVTGAWLDARVPTGAPAAAGVAAAPARNSAVLVAPGVHETAEYLDASRRLFGIVAAPSEGPRPTRAVLLLNSGANHHIGPGRLYVLLARRWAARGCLVMRVDLSGIGDSVPPPGEAEKVVYPRWAVRDVEDALGHLRDQWGATSFVAMGVCSGAYHALKAAVAQVPLTGVILINPLVFFWKQGMSLNYPAYEVTQSARRYKQSLFEVDKWKKLIIGKVDLREIAQVVARRAASVMGGSLRDVARKSGRPLADDLGVELEGLTERHVSVAFVFAAGNPGEELLRVQAGSSLRRLMQSGLVRVHRIEGPNHTFTPLWSHTMLADTLDRELGL